MFLTLRVSSVWKQPQPLAFDPELRRRGRVDERRDGEVDLVEYLTYFVAYALSDLGLSVLVPFCDSGVFEEVR